MLKWTVFNKRLFLSRTFASRGLPCPRPRAFAARLVAPENAITNPGGRVITARKKRPLKLVPLALLGTSWKFHTRGSNRISSDSMCNRGRCNITLPRWRTGICEQQMGLTYHLKNLETEYLSGSCEPCLLMLQTTYLVTSCLEKATLSR